MTEGSPHIWHVILWVDDWDLNAWCDACRLPSGVAVTKTQISRNWVDAPYREFLCVDCGIRRR